MWRVQSDKWRAMPPPPDAAATHCMPSCYHTPTVNFPYVALQSTFSISTITLKKLKFFPSHKAHRAALISVSVALSQTPAEAVSPRTRSYSVSRGVPPFQFILLGKQRHMCVNNLYRVVTWTGTRTCDQRPFGCKSWRPNHYATIRHTTLNMTFTTKHNAVFIPTWMIHVTVSLLNYW